MSANVVMELLMLLSSGLFLSSLIVGAVLRSDLFGVLHALLFLASLALPSHAFLQPKSARSALAAPLSRLIPIIPRISTFLFAIGLCVTFWIALFVHNFTAHLLSPATAQLMRDLFGLVQLPTLPDAREVATRIISELIICPLAIISIVLMLISLRLSLSVEKEKTSQQLHQHSALPQQPDATSAAAAAVVPADGSTSSSFRGRKKLHQRQRTINASTVDAATAAAAIAAKADESIIPTSSSSAAATAAVDPTLAHLAAMQDIGDRRTRRMSRALDPASLRALQAELVAEDVGVSVVSPGRQPTLLEDLRRQSSVRAPKTSRRRVTLRMNNMDPSLLSDEVASVPSSSAASTPAAEHLVGPTSGTGLITVTIPQIGTSINGSVEKAPLTRRQKRRLSSTHHKPAPSNFTSVLVLLLCLIAGSMYPTILGYAFMFSFLLMTLAISFKIRFFTRSAIRVSIATTIAFYSALILIAFAVSRFQFLGIVRENPFSQMFGFVEVPRKNVGEYWQVFTFVSCVTALYAACCILVNGYIADMISIKNGDHHLRLKGWRRFKRRLWRTLLHIVSRRSIEVVKQFLRSCSAVILVTLLIGTSLSFPSIISSIWLLFGYVGIMVKFPVFHKMLPLVHFGLMVLSLMQYIFNIPNVSALVSVHLDIAGLSIMAKVGLAPYSGWSPLLFLLHGLMALSLAITFRVNLGIKPTVSLIRPVTKAVVVAQRPRALSQASEANEMHPLLHTDDASQDEHHHQHQHSMVSPQQTLQRKDSVISDAAFSDAQLSSVTTASVGFLSRFTLLVQIYDVILRLIIGGLGLLIRYSYFLSLAVVYFAAMTSENSDLLHGGFLIFLVSFLTFPALAKRAWPLLVLYTQAFMLALYVFNIIKPQTSSVATWWLRIFGLVNFGQDRYAFWVPLAWHALILAFTSIQYRLLHVKDIRSLLNDTRPNKEIEFPTAMRFVIAVASQIFRLLGAPVFFTISLGFILFVHDATIINMIHLQLFFIFLALSTTVGSKWPKLVAPVWHVIALWCGAVLTCTYIYQVQGIDAQLDKLLKMIPYNDVVKIYAKQIGFENFAANRIPKAIGMLPSTVLLLIAIFVLKFNNYTFIFKNKAQKDDILAIDDEEAKQKMQGVGNPQFSRPLLPAQLQTLLREIVLHTKRFAVLHSPKVLLFLLFVCANSNVSVIGLLYMVVACLFAPVPSISFVIWPIAMVFSMLSATGIYLMQFPFFRDLDCGHRNPEPAYCQWLDFVGLKTYWDVVPSAQVNGALIFQLIWEMLLVMIFAAIHQVCSNWKHQLQQRGQYQAGLIFIEHRPDEFKPDSDLIHHSLPLYAWHVCKYYANHAFEVFGYEINLLVILLGSIASIRTIWGLIYLILFGISVFAGKRIMRQVWWLVVFWLELDIVLIFVFKILAIHPFPLAPTLVQKIMSWAGSPYIFTYLGVRSDGSVASDKILIILYIMLFFSALQARTFFAERQRNRAQRTAAEASGEPQQTAPTKKISPTKMLLQKQREMGRMHVYMEPPKDRPDFTLPSRPRNYLHIAKHLVFYILPQAALITVFLSATFAPSLLRLVPMALALLYLNLGEYVSWKANSAWVPLGFFLWANLFIQTVYQLPLVLIRVYIGHDTIDPLREVLPPVLAWLPSVMELIGLVSLEDPLSKCWPDIIVLSLYYIVQTHIFGSTDYIFLTNSLFRKRVNRDILLERNIAFRTARFLKRFAEQFKTKLRQKRSMVALNQAKRQSIKTSDSFDDMPDFGERSASIKSELLKVYHESASNKMFNVEGVQDQFIDQLKEIELNEVIIKVISESSKLQRYLLLSRHLSVKKIEKCLLDREGKMSELDELDYGDSDISPEVQALLLGISAEEQEEMTRSRSQARFDVDEASEITAPVAPATSQEKSMSIEDKFQLLLKNRKDSNASPARSRAASSGVTSEAAPSAGSPPPVPPRTSVSIAAAAMAATSTPSPKDHGPNTPAFGSSVEEAAKVVSIPEVEPQPDRFGEARQRFLRVLCAVMHVSNIVLDFIMLFMESYLINVSYDKNEAGDLVSARQALEQDVDALPDVRLRHLVRVFRHKLHQLFTVIKYAYVSNTDTLCYLVFMLTVVISPTIPNMVFTLAAFLFGCISSPVPHRYFWVAMHFWAELMIALQYLFALIQKVFGLNQNVPVYDSVYLLGWNPSTAAVRDIVMYAVAMLVIGHHRTILKQRGDWETTFTASSKKLEKDASEDSAGESDVDTEADAEEEPMSPGAPAQYQRNADVDSDDEDRTESDADEYSSGAESDILERNPENLVLEEGQVGAAPQDDELDKLADTGIILTQDQMKQNFVFQQARKFIRFYQRVLDSKIKIGFDFYVIQLCLELLCLVLFFLTFPYLTSNRLVGTQTLAEAAQANELPGSFVIFLLLFFLFIILDRIIYLYASLRAKLLFHYATVLFYHILFLVVYDNLSSSFNTLGRFCLSLLFVLKCISLWISALQLRDGYPKNTHLNFFMRSTHWLVYYVYLGWRVIPFLYELKTLLDWTFTKTSLTFSQWIKFEDLWSQLYARKSAQDQAKIYYRRLGTPTPLRTKLLLGLVMFVGLAGIIFFPLMFYSTYNPTFNLNIASDFKLVLNIRGAGFSQSLFLGEMHVDNKDLVPYKDFFSEKYKIAAEDLSTDFDPTFGFQRFQLPPWSETYWLVSDESMLQLVQFLGDDSRQVNLTVRYEASRQLQEQSKTKTKNSADSLQTSGDQDIVLSPQQRQQLRDIVQGNATSNTLQLPFAFTPLLVNRPYSLDAVRLTDPYYVSRYTTNCTLQYTEQNKRKLPLWRFDCLELPLQRQIPDDQNTFVAQSQSTNANGVTLDMQVRRVAQQTGILGVLSQYGIVAFYSTFVLAVGRFIRSYMSGQVQRIWIEDLQDVDLVYFFAQDIYAARAVGDLSLEESIFNTLMEIFSDTHTLKKWTAPGVLFKNKIE